MSHIFISYSRKDIDFAQKIVDALAANDLDTWIDWESIPKGENWWEHIQSGIEEAEAFILLVSPDSIKSEICSKEIDHAVINGKRILPVVLEDVSPQDAHPEISKRNWIFCRQGQDDFEKAIAETRETIHTDYEWLKYHTRLQVKALEWEKRQDTSRLLRGRELREAEEQVAGVGSQKDPQPTILHRNYILASQRYEVRQRRQVTIGLGVGMIIVAVLAVFSWNQRNNALNSEATAIAESNARATAQYQSEQESQARATAQYEAEQEAIISNAGNLAAQSINLSNSQLDLALLLSIEAYEKAQTIQTYNALNTAWGKDPQIKKFLLGHTSGIIILDWSLDGKLATGSRDETVIVWDIEGNKPKHYIKPFPNNPMEEEIKCLKWLTNEYLAINNIIWDLENNTTVNAIGNIENSIGHCAWSNDNRYFADISNGIKIWDASTGKLKNELITDRPNSSQLLPGYWTTVIWLPNGNLVTAGCFEAIIADCLKGDIAVWDIESGESVMGIQGHTSSIQSIASSPDGKLASGDLDGTIIIWNLKTGQPLKTLNGHVGEISSLAWLSDDILASASGRLNFDGLGQSVGNSDNSIIIWDLSNDQPEQIRYTNRYDINSLAWSQDGILAAGTGLSNWFDYQIVLIDPAVEFNSITLEEHEANDMAWSSDDRLAIGSSDSSVVAWTPDDNFVQTLLGHRTNVTDVSWSLNNLLASMDSDGTVIIWNLNTNQPEEIYHIEDTYRGLHWLSNGQLATVGLDKRIITIFPDQIISLEPDGNQRIGGLMSWFLNDFLATTVWSDIVLWDITNGKPNRIRTGFIHRVSSLAWSPDGRLASSSCNVPTGETQCIQSIIKIWDPNEKAFVRELVGHKDWVNTLSWSNDNRLASGSADGTIMIWDIKSGRSIQTIQPKDILSIDQIEWSRNGLLAFISEQGIIHILQLNPEVWIRQNCQRVGRNLSQDEWTRYFPNEEYRLTCPQWPAGE